VKTTNTHVIRKQGTIFHRHRRPQTGRADTDTQPPRVLSRINVFRPSVDAINFRKLSITVSVTVLVIPKRVADVRSRLPLPTDFGCSNEGGCHAKPHRVPSSTSIVSARNFYFGKRPAVIRHVPVAGRKGIEWSGWFMTELAGWAIGYCARVCNIYRQTRTRSFSPCRTTILGHDEYCYS